MTAVLDEVRDAPAADAVVTDRAAASWLARAGAFAIDMLMPLGVIATMALVALSTSFGDWMWWVAVSAGGVVILLIGINRLVLPAITGWSLGRSLFGIRVVQRDGSSVGPWRLLVRDAAHVLDTAGLFVGWLWPLWDSRNRTFADLLTHTEVRRVGERPARARRLTAVALSAVALLAVAAAGLSYLEVYRHDNAVNEARAEIQKQGPKIVADILSYGAASLDADFANAQSLTTENYRPQLVAQQDAVKKRGPTTNEYWAANSAVIAVSPDRASMLIMLQGQRAVSQKEQRFITATVRVSFEKSAQGPWRVADLTVLTRPHASEAPK